MAAVLAGWLQVRALQISSNARICEVAVASPGEPPSYVGTVRAAPADGMPGVHTLRVAVPRVSGCRLLLKMLSLVEKSRWQLHRLAFVTDAPALVPAGSSEQVRSDTCCIVVHGCLARHEVPVAGLWTLASGPLLVARAA